MNVSMGRQCNESLIVHNTAASSLSLREKVRVRLTRVGFFFSPSPRWEGARGKSSA
jgi:hypothetical protein